MATAMFALSASAAVSPSFSVQRSMVMVTSAQTQLPGDATPLVLNGKPVAITSVKSTVDFLSMSPKQFEAATGKKLNFFQKFKFKIGQKIARKSAAGDCKSKTTAILLALFLGGLGIHRFYLGYTWQGIVQILTLGGLGIWALIDLVRIITGDLKPKDGDYCEQ